MDFIFLEGDGFPVFMLELRVLKEGIPPAVFKLIRVVDSVAENAAPFVKEVAL